MAAVEDTVRAIVAKHLEVGPDAIDLDKPLDETADSIGLSIIVVALEQRFGIAFDDRDIARARNLRDVVRLIEHGAR